MLRVSRLPAANEETIVKGFVALLSLGTALASISAQEPAPVPSFHWVDGATFRAMQGDPADSLYRVAHDLLARGEYGRSAQLFKDIAQKYPKSRYQDDLPYNEAFARYRIGTTRELETAAHVLEPRAKKLLGVVAASSASSDGGVASGRARAISSVSTSASTKYWRSTETATPQKGSVESFHRVRTRATAKMRNSSAKPWAC